MADPVVKSDISSSSLAKDSQKQTGKLRLDPININLGRTGLPQESRLPFQKEAKLAPSPAPAVPKAAAAAKPAVGAKLVAGAKPAATVSKPEASAKPAAPAAKGAPVAKAAPAANGSPAAKAAPPAKGAPVASAAPTAKGAPVAKAAPAAKGTPVAKAAPPAKGAPVASAAPTAKVAPPVAPAAPAALKKAAPREKDHFFIIENLCVGCGLCLDKCPPKVKAIGYKFYGDVQEGGFRAYIDQDACISCASCFNAGECPAAALVKVHPDGEVLDYVYTPPERLDFDLRFLHRFHREVR